MRLFAIPLELKEANAAVAAWHRHHKPVQGHRFSVGCVDESGTLHGAATIGRPVARLAGLPRDVLEVTRLVTDGTPNACSILYAAAARAGKALGYRRIQTYILLGDEVGTSLRASGWKSDGPAGGGQWKHTDGKARRTDQPTAPKERWSLDLAVRPDLSHLPNLETQEAGAEHPVDEQRPVVAEPLNTGRVDDLIDGGLGVGEKVVDGDPLLLRDLSHADTLPSRLATRKDGV